ncbi:MAG: hypothetical protein H6722_13425 [Sandaracinus sp.]|nr:hypothetical protein [Sandaracinus sp.]MCB9604690.1 hypothetical protein [Sandaracinus sp.]MCB9613444.1 hypothetical protein [Sandaracinus sp.]
MDLSSLAPLIALAVFFVAWPFLRVRLELLKSRLRLSSRSMSLGLAEGLEPHAEYFADLFAPLGLEPLEASFDDENVVASMFFVDAERSVLACVQLGAGTTLQLLGRSVDGTLVTTYVGPGAWGITVPGRRERLALDEDLAEVLAGHREAVGTSCPFGEREAFDLLPALVELGLFRPIDDEWVRPTWRGAHVWANALQRSRVAAAATAGHPWRVGVPPLPVRLRVAFHESTRRHTHFALPSRYRWALGVGTALAFVVLGLVVWPWQVMLALFVVVTIHELGHAVAMVLTGHRDVWVFFLPLLGGFAQGRATRTSVEREAVVLLAGPLPGLFLAWPLLQTHSPTLQALGNAALALNALNLLPAPPLDGGRLMASLLPNRDQVQDSLGVVSAVGLCALAFHWSELLLAVLAIWILHTTYRRGDFTRHLAPFRREATAVRELDEGARLQALHAAVAERGYHDVMSAVSLVEVLDHAAQRSRSPWVTRGVVGAVYLAILALAVYVLAPTLIA